MELFIFRKSNRNSPVFIGGVLYFFTFVLHAGAADPVAPGEGSIASAPPDHKKIGEFYAKEPLLGPQARTRPLPTNDWWTSLLTESPFPGTLFVMPLTVTPDDRGLQIDFRQTWSENGSEFPAGHPLRITGSPQTPGLPGLPGLPGDDILLTDFEQETWPRSWKTTGNAFGPGPMTHDQKPSRNLSGNRFACSFRENNQGTGTLTSPPFLLNRDYLHFRVSGGDDPETLGVQLIVAGEVIHQAVGDRSNHLKDQRWDLREWQGRQAQIRLIDQHTGGWGFIAADAFILSNQDTPTSPGPFARCSTINWGDWSVKMGLHGNGSARFEVTLVRGLPFLWIETVDMAPGIDLLPGDTLLDPRGSPVTFPYARTQLLLRRGDVLYSLHAPASTVFTRSGNALGLQAAAGNPFLIIGALPDLPLAATYHEHAYAIPRNTHFSWVYEPEQARVLTRWRLQTDPLQGSQTATLQGWLPHHWRNIQPGLKLLPAEIPTQRGPMRLAAGQDFRIAYPFAGLPIALPLPEPDPSASPAFNPAYLDQILSDWIADQQRRSPSDRAGGDTYWGGKKILSLARTATLADQRNHPLAAEALNLIREALSDWFTYTPGETERYFARYPAPWNGVVGFNPSYGSETFSDAHFHHGYFTLSAALLARLDPAWGERYREVAVQVAKQYANWDRADSEFPFLRTFSPWVGHSYAGGGSNPQDGNNQESTSESMMGWAGLFLLGAALDIPEMRDCGAMGLAIEGEAIREYWNDYYAWRDPQAPAVFPPAYRAQHSIVGVRRDRDMGYWTWFSGEAIHIYGIQWLPTWTHLQYLGHDPAFVTAQNDAMLRRQGVDAIVDLGRDWGHVALGHLMWGDPEQVLRILADAASSGAEVGDWRNGGVTFALATSLRALGHPDPRAHSDLPTGTVYRSLDGRRIWTGWNPHARPVEVNFSIENQVIDQVSLPPGRRIHTRILPSSDNPLNPPQ